MDNVLDEPVSAFDVSCYLIDELGGNASSNLIEQIRLHKLLFYCQAAALVWSAGRLFFEPIQAWANGPVVAEIWRANRYRPFLSKSDLGGDSSRLTMPQRMYVQAITNVYGELQAGSLIDMTHEEAPWKNARIGVRPGDPSKREIPLDSMRHYFRERWLTD